METLIGFTTSTLIAPVTTIIDPLFETSEFAGLLPAGDAFGKLLCVSQEWRRFLAANHDWQLLEANLPKFRPIWYSKS